MKGKIFRFLYAAVAVTPLFLTVLVPIFIQGGVSVRQVLIGKEILQGFSIALLLTMSYGGYLFYQRQRKKQIKMIQDLKQNNRELEDQLDDSVKYIGKVNLQFREIKSILSSIKDFPTNKREFKKILKTFCEKTLGVVEADWVMFRIIETKKTKTLTESIETRSKAVLLKHEVSNKMLVEGNKIEGFSVVGTEQNSTPIKAFCIVPKKALSDNQRTIIKTILSQMEMLFLISTSKYYEEGYLQGLGRSKKETETNKDLQS